MRRRDLALLPLLFAIPLTVKAGSARASEPEAKVDTGQYIDIAPVALPVAVNNRLINYIFVSTRVNLNNSVDASKMREKEPFLRDALVRAGHRTPFTLESDYTRIDEGKLKAALWREAVAILGQRNVVSVVVTSQTPKQRTGIPRPPQAARGPDRP